MGTESVYFAVWTAEVPMKKALAYREGGEGGTLATRDVSSVTAVLCDGGCMQPLARLRPLL